MSKQSSLRIRLASQHDLDELVRLENLGFTQDRFSEDQIDYLLTRAHCHILVAESDGKLAGAAYLLWRQRSDTGRLYNLVVDPAVQGRGIGAQVMDAFELEAARLDLTEVSLEVRTDNHNAIRFYQRRGYDTTHTLEAYYDDGCDGLRMVKKLSIEVPRRVQLPIAYYAQTLDFTCGPASLMMAWNYLAPHHKPSRILELRLWKEATSVFMMSGVGGTGPFGLALAALRRDLSARIIASSTAIPFVASVRDRRKQEVIRLVHNDLRHSALDLGCSFAMYEYSFRDLRSALLRGAVPIVLISSYRLTNDRFPHWVVVTGFDRHHVYIHDPNAESYGRRAHRAQHMQLTWNEFARMNRYGKDHYRCALMIGPRNPSM